MTGWVLPGLVDAHCHVGLDAHGAVDGPPTEQQALRRPRRRDPAHPRRRLAGRHPLGGRPRGPAAHRPGRPAHRPDPPLHPQLRPRDRARGPRRRTCARRPGAVTAGSSWSVTGSTATPATWRPAGRARPLVGGGRRGARRGGPGDRALLRRGVAARLRRGRHRLHRARHRPRAPTPIDAVRGAGRRHRPDAGQHRHLPGHRRRRARTSSRRTPRTCATCTPAATRRWRPRTTPACRSTSGPTPAARCRTGWSRRRPPSWSRPGCRPPRPWTRRPGGPAAGCGRPGLVEGEQRRPGGLRGRPAQGHRRAGRARARGAARARCRLSPARCARRDRGSGSGRSRPADLASYPLAVELSRARLSPVEPGRPRGPGAPPRRAEPRPPHLPHPRQDTRGRARPGRQGQRHQRRAGTVPVRRDGL